MNPGSLALIVLGVALNAFAQIALRKAMLLAHPLPPLGRPVLLALALARNPYLWGGIGCYVLSLGIWLAVLARTQVSVAYPMLSIGYVIAALLGIVWLGEPVNPARWLGILVICAGVVLVARSA